MIENGTTPEANLPVGKERIRDDYSRVRHKVSHFLFSERVVLLVD